jgi:tetratricopeptide (TPR) repeat protein
VAVDQADLFIRAGRFGEAATFAEEARLFADTLGNARLSARARLAAAVVRAEMEQTGLGELLDEAEAVLPVFEAAHDHSGVARALGAIGMVNWTHGRLDPAGLMYQRVIEELELSGQTGRIPRIKGIMALTTAQGRTDVTSAGVLIDELAHEVEGDPQGMSLLLSAVASIQSMAGRHEEARRSLERAVMLADSLGMDVDALFMAADRGTLELLAGDAIAAESAMRPAFDRMSQLDDPVLAGTLAAVLADAVARQARDQEAIELTELAERLLQVEDVSGQALWRAARARALVSSGRASEAVELASEAVELLRPTDFLNQFADTHVVLAEALAASGKDTDAREVLSQAHEAYLRKGNVVMTEKTMEMLARGRTPAAGDGLAEPV